MRGIKSIAVSTLVAGLLASSAIGALGQSETASSFTLDIVGPPIDVSFDETTGLERLVLASEASDPRAQGVITLHAARGRTDDADHQYTVSREGVRLTTDDGAWVGTLVSTDLHDVEAETNAGGGFFDLAGEGAYEGLSMFITAAPEQGLQGMIVPSDIVPTQPEPPAE